jgi:hypothetical protein
MRLPKNGSKGTGDKAHRQFNDREAARKRAFRARASQASQDGAAGAGDGASAPTDENAGPVAQRRVRPVAMAAFAGLFLVGLLPVRGFCGISAPSPPHPLTPSPPHPLTPSSALYSRRRGRWCRHAPCSGYGGLYVCGPCTCCPGLCPGGECGNWNQGCYFFRSPSLDQPPAFSSDGGWLWQHGRRCGVAGWYFGVGVGRGARGAAGGF